MGGRPRLKQDFVRFLKWVDGSTTFPYSVTKRIDDVAAVLSLNL